MTCGRGRGGAAGARRVRHVLAGGVLAVGLLAGCGSEEGPAGAATADELEGRTFVATGADGVRLVDQITLAFEDGNVIGNGGCNVMRGGYTVDEGVLQVEVLAQTMKGCDPAHLDQDAWLAALLTDEPEVSLDGRPAAGPHARRLADNGGRRLAGRTRDDRHVGGPRDD